MSGLDITIILGNKQRQLPKPFNNRPGYDMKYVMIYLNYYHPIYYGENLEKLFDTEKKYDNLSIVKRDEKLIQWAVRVRIDLQDLLSENKLGMYHRYCLFASYPGGRLVFRADVDIKPKKTFDHAYKRFAEMVEPKDLMQDHWDNYCSRPKTDFGRARIIQRAWRRFQEKEPSNARLAWNSLPNDNTPDDKKFLGLTQHKIKNPQTREQFDQWRTKSIAMYKQCNLNIPLDIYVREYEEYYIPYNWIDSKKSQLQSRFQKRLLEIEA
nr:12381_t:CDS:2 [Entrophospora candida]